jgi:hypothetical protein
MGPETLQHNLSVGYDPVVSREEEHTEHISFVESICGDDCCDDVRKSADLLRGRGYGLVTRRFGLALKTKLAFLSLLTL